MRNDLLDLIEHIDDIKIHFHVGDGKGLPSVKIIYDKSEFSSWKQEVQLELQAVYDRTKDKFIWSTLVTLKQGFNGWTDETKFNDLVGSLHAIRKNIDKYYPSEIPVKEKMEVVTMLQKSPKVFISHAEADKDYVSELVDLLEGIGLNEQQIFCSSIAGYGIPLDQDIYDYLKQQFETHNLHVLFVLSENYYKSIACMNEMGAAWILQNRYTTILLPGFEFKEIRGAINPRQIGIKIDNELADVKEKLGQLKDYLLSEFAISAITDARWERRRDVFINSVTSQGVKTELSENALTLLQAACAEHNGTIISIRTFDGTSIIVGTQQFVTSQERREVAKWESALEELLNLDFVHSRGSKGEIFDVTKKGYDYIEKQ